MLGKILSYVGPAPPYATSVGANIGLNAFNFYRTYSHFSNNPDHYKATEIIGYASCAVPAIAAAYIHSTNTLDYALLASTAVTAGCYAVNSLCRKDVKEVGLLVAASAVLGMQFYPKAFIQAGKSVYNYTPETGISSAICSGLGSVLSYAGTGIWNVAWNAAISCANHTSTLLTSHESYVATSAHMAGAAFSIFVGANMMASALTDNKDLDTRIKYLEDLNGEIKDRVLDPDTLARTNINVPQGMTRANYVTSLTKRATHTDNLIVQAKNDESYGTYGLIASTLTMATPLLVPALPASIIVGASVAAKIYCNSVVRSMKHETTKRYSDISTGAQNLGIAVS